MFLKADINKEMPLKAISIFDKRHSETILVCQSCHSVVETEYNYCPNCGQRIAFPKARAAGAVKSKENLPKKAVEKTVKMETAPAVQEITAKPAASLPTANKAESKKDGGKEIIVKTKDNKNLSKIKKEIKEETACLKTESYEKKTEVKPAASSAKGVSKKEAGENKE